MTAVICEGRNEKVIFEPESSGSETFFRLHKPLHKRVVKADSEARGKTLRVGCMTTP
jgi:hypothetical protein